VNSNDSSKLSRATVVLRPDATIPLFQERFDIARIVFRQVACGRIARVMELFVVLPENKVIEHHKDDVMERRIRALRLRAEEARTSADGMHHTTTRATMLQIARVYDHTAALLESVPNHGVAGHSRKASILCSQTAELSRDRARSCT
jgi:hypothetical protein